jgi:hypothetical protein
MSRTKTYGHSVAIQTSGPDAVPDHEKDAANKMLGKMLDNAFREQLRALWATGVEIDIDTFEDFDHAEDDRHVYGYTFKGRQTRNILQRILWAVRL